MNEEKDNLHPEDTDTSVQDVAPEIHTGGRRSNKKRIIVIIILVLLLAAGAGVWCFLHKNKPVAQQNKVNVTATTPQSIYLQVTHDSTDYDLRMLNTSTKAVKKLATVKGAQSFVKLSSGAIRYLVYSDAQNADKSTTAIFALQDDTSSPKVIFTEKTSTEDNKTNKTLWPGPMNATGTKMYFYEQNNITGETRIASVDESGKVEDIVKGQNFKFETGLDSGIGPFLTPQAVSTDEKTIYLQPHSCLNCDGPPHADVVAYDVATKKFTLLMADPSGDRKGYGFWTKLSDNYLAVYATSISNFGPMTYADALADKEWLYLYDLRTGKSTKVFETAGDNVVVSALQLSSDEKTFYYYTQGIVKGDSMEAKDPKDPTVKGQFEFDYATNEYRAYDIAADKSTAIDFGLDAELYQPVFLSSNNDSYILGIEVRRPRFTPTTADVATVSPPKTVYLAAKSTPKDPKKIYQTEPADSMIMSWGGFAD